MTELETAQLESAREETAALRAQVSVLTQERNKAELELSHHRLERSKLGPMLVIAEQIHKKGVTPEVIAGYEMLQTAVTVLRLNSDVRDGIKNYVEIAMVGLALPFDRAAVHLIRPGGKTPHELRAEAQRQFNCALVVASQLADDYKCETSATQWPEIDRKIEWLRAGCP